MRSMSFKVIQDHNKRKFSGKCVKAMCTFDNLATFYGFLRITTFLHNTVRRAVSLRQLSFLFKQTQTSILSDAAADPYTVYTNCAQKPLADKNNLWQNSHGEIVLWHSTVIPVWMLWFILKPWSHCPTRLNSTQLNWSVQWPQRPMRCGHWTDQLSWVGLGMWSLKRVCCQSCSST